MARKWLQVILAKVEKAYEMGFDGVYLDNIDARIVISELDLGWAKNLNLTKLMVEALYRLSTLVKEKYGKSFKVYVNIGSAVELLAEEKFLASIDGVLREEVWYTIKNGKCVKVDPRETKYVLKYLREARLKGKTVIVADFLENKEMTEDFCSLCWYYGFIPVPQPA
ncbi:MAG: hypothetical protein DRN04_08630 [Thermoprotei archaeon]|nr:MAG: hypothetical protein DRN04_08630 [Thermoprotei archaeon]